MDYRQRRLKWKKSKEGLIKRSYKLMILIYTNYLTLTTATMADTCDLEKPVYKQVYINGILNYLKKINIRSYT